MSKYSFAYIDQIDYYYYDTFDAYKYTVSYKLVVNKDTFKIVTKYAFVDTFQMKSFVSEDVFKQYVIKKTWEDVVASHNIDNAKILFDNILDNNYSWKPKASPVAKINNVRVSDWADGLPGSRQIVAYPCLCGLPIDQLSHVIMHLNDRCRWSREKIADWLDEQHDAGNINIEFDSEPITKEKL